MDSDAKRLSAAIKDGIGGGVARSGEERIGSLNAEGLGSLFSQALGSLTGRIAEPGREPAPIVAQASDIQIPEMNAVAHCDELVDRILASPPSADGAAEVRIRIDKPWLPDTEVRLTLSADSRLEVEFQADSPEAQRFLLPNLGNLRERLAERGAGEVTVRMTEQSREGGGDGRSRNRRSVIEELDGE